MSTLLTLYKKIKLIRIPKEISWYTAAQIISQVLSFIGILFIIRYLGPVRLGLYSFAQNFISVFLSCVNGLELYFTWQIARNEHDKVKEARKFFGHKLHITLSITIISIILAAIALPSDVAILCIVISLPLFLHSFTAFTLYSSANNNASIYAKSQILSSIALLISRIVLVVLKADLVYIVLLSSFDLILTSILISAHYLSQKKWSIEFFSHKLPKYKDTLILMFKIRFSILAFTFWQLILRADQLILATFAGAYVLGIYSAATKIAEIPNFIAGILYIYTIPKFSKTANNLILNNTSFLHKYKKIILSYTAVSVFIAFMIIVFAPYIVNIIYGPEYHQSIYILQLYAMSIPPMFLTYFFFSLYGSENKYKLQSFIFAISLLINILTIKILYSFYGLPGIAISNFISYTILVIIFGLVYNLKYTNKIKAVQ